MKRQQCKTCPWIKSNGVSDIPNYDLELHKSLIETIAERDGNISKIGKPVAIMVCHYSSGENQIPCVGWLNNQLGDGNNVQLRIYFGVNFPGDSIETIGEQKENFQQTFEDREVTQCIRLPTEPGN